MKIHDKPKFLISIDTEGDNLWGRPRKLTTENAKFLPRFQELCEKYGLKPTYLTTFEMANDPVFIEFGRDILKRNTGEIGMHLHAWDSPPLVPLTADDAAHHPFAYEYPSDILRQKMELLTAVLEDNFGVKMVSHRAGRYGFNATVARILQQLDYRVDCSVTPLLSWSYKKGDPRQKGGMDFTHFPSDAYFLNPDDISQPGSSNLLEVPLTIFRKGIWFYKLMHRTFSQFPGFRRVSDRFLPEQLLRPTGYNLDSMLYLLRRSLQLKKEYVQFMLHSSEFMPGGSPVFPNRESVERLFRQLEVLFAEAAGNFSRATLQEFYKIFREETTISPAVSK